MQKIDKTIDNDLDYFETIFTLHIQNKSVILCLVTECNSSINIYKKNLDIKSLSLYLIVLLALINKQHNTWYI